MNKQAIETEYKRICDKLGFIPKEFKPAIPKDVSEDYGHIETLFDYLRQWNLFVYSGFL